MIIMTKVYNSQMNPETPVLEFKLQNRSQAVCRRALLTLGTPKEWATALGLSGEFADRTIRAWASGETKIPEKRIMLILDAADLFFRNSAELQIEIFDARKEILKGGRK